jgi:acyl carrier protein
MTKAEILESLDKLVGEILEADDLRLTRETTADDVDGWDSVAHVNILVAVESTFGIRFDSREIGSLSSVGVLIDMIDVKLNGATV